MPGIKKTKNYFLYVIAIFASAIFAFFGKPAPEWVMRATAQTASTSPMAHKTPAKRAVASARRTTRTSRTTSRRQSAGRSQAKPTRLARKKVETTGLAAAAIAFDAHHG